MTLSEKIFMQRAIENLLLKGVINECDHKRSQFISKIFLVPKPEGSRRFILNLKQLNKFVDIKHFKLEDFRTAIKLISRDCYLGSIDLKDAYFLVPVHVSHKKFLRFIFDEKLYEFNCLPFGLATAPYVFTKLMKPVMFHLRKNGLTSVVYLDDFLLIGSSYASCSENIRKTEKLLDELGFIINYNKSHLIPKQTCKFLGFIFNTVDMSLRLPREKEK